MPQYSKRNDIKAQIISASVRNACHVIECAKAGADLATVPYSVIEQMLKHPLTAEGIENSKKTIEQYLEANMEAVDRKTVSTIRALCADTVEKANSGHPGLPLRLQF